MSADLHIHTTFSDGTLTPAEIVREAKKAGLKTIAITDHDVVDGIEEARREAQRVGIEVIPGIEITTEIPGYEIHILGYYIDYNSPELSQILKKIQEDRSARIGRIVAKLDKLGVKIDTQRVLEVAGRGSAGRPHVARVLLEAGYVKSIREAFNRYLDYKAPAYEPHYKLTPPEAIKLILSAGGIPVYAHPGTSKCDHLIPDLIGSGLLGLEVYHTGHGQTKTKHYLRLAQKYGLLVTGGSDFHGLGSGRETGLGSIAISDELVEKLKEAVSRK